jgi:hypothetical protein
MKDEVKAFKTRQRSFHPSAFILHPSAFILAFPGQQGGRRLYPRLGIKYHSSAINHSCFESYP